jgi:hypothetical protein
MKAATPNRGANAAGQPLHPVCVDHGARVHIVVTTGDKYLTCVALPRRKGSIHLVKLDPFDHGLQELTRLNEKTQLRELYPVKKAINYFLKLGKEKGITDGARDALVELKKSFVPVGTKPTEERA